MLIGILSFCYILFSLLLSVNCIQLEARNTLAHGMRCRNLTRKVDRSSVSEHRSFVCFVSSSIRAVLVLRATKIHRHINTCATNKELVRNGTHKIKCSPPGAGVTPSSSALPSLKVIPRAFALVVAPIPTTKKPVSTLSPTHTAQQRTKELPRVEACTARSLIMTSPVGVMVLWFGTPLTGTQAAKDPLKQGSRSINMVVFEPCCQENGDDIML